MKKIVWILLASVAAWACEDPDGQEAPQPDAAVEIGTESLEFLPTGEIAAGDNAVRVTSSGPWRLTGRRTWCEPSATEGESGDVVSFAVAPNPAAEPRSELFTFVCGGSTARLVVSQRYDDVIECSQDGFELDNAGGLIRLRTESSVDITAEIAPEGTDWITPFVTKSVTRAMQTSWLYWTVAANDTYNPRESSIVVRGEGVEPRVLPVRQAQTDMLQVEGETQFKGDLTSWQVRVAVWSNIPFEAVIPEDARGWLTLSAAPTVPQEWSQQELVFDLAAAEDFRMAQVKLKTAVPELDQTLVFQQGEAKLLQFPDPNFRGYLLGEGFIVASGEGYLLTAEGKAATALDLYTTLWQAGGVASAEGIEHFTNLTTLVCRYGRLRSLDISATKVADLSACVPNALETLHAGPLATTIDFGPAYSWGDGNLYDYTTKSGGYPYTYYWAQSLVVTGENLTSIDVSQNKLRTLDVSGCPKLRTLVCTMQENLLETVYMSEAQRGTVTVTKDGNTQIVYR